MWVNFACIQNAEDAFPFMDQIMPLPLKFCKNISDIENLGDPVLGFVQFY